MTGLEVNGRVDPLGLDDASPELGWRLESDARGAAQTAYRVLVASTPEVLAGDRGDLFDSGRVEAAAAGGIEYRGEPLRSRQAVHWKVKLWDEGGEPTEWSRPARWEVGVLEPGDWSEGVRWITDPELLKWRRGKLGYRSQDADEGVREKWIQCDLGRVVPLDTLRLRAVSHSVEERTGFPLRFRVEVADEPGFRQVRVVVPERDEDFNRWISTIDLPLDGVRARFVRFVATKLRVTEGSRCLAVSQVEVVSRGRNLAPAASFTASDSLENDDWSLAALNDGLDVPGGNPRASDTLRLRRSFQVGDGLTRATLRVSGLGQCVPSVNGRQVDGGARLVPGWTDYARTCLYETLDVTGALHEGDNVLGLTLAGGFFNAQPVKGRYRKLATAFRPLMAWGELQLDYADGRRVFVPTDTRWRVRPGPTRLAHIYAGEDFDARAEDPASPGGDDAGWVAAVATEGPGGRLRGTAFASPPLAAHETLVARSVAEPEAGVSVYDFGQNAPVMPALRVRGPEGSRVRLVPAELLKEDGRVDRGSAGGGNAWWEYTLRGDPEGEEWTPSFFYHGARYLQAERFAGPGDGLPVIESLEAQVVHSASPPAGSFRCSDELFNRVHRLVRWAQRSNMAHVLTDCPHRERLGWLEQYHLNGPSLRYGWDLRRLFRKCFHDMADAQRPDGLVPNIAPEYTVFWDAFRDSPEWGSALILAAWQHHAFTGDAAPLREHYDAMTRYLGYLGSRASGHVVDHGLGDWYDVGPEPPGYAQLTPVALTATATYYEDARKLAAIARVIGRAADAEEHGRLAAEIREAFNRKFLDPGTGRYASGSQTAQAMPIALGLVPEDCRARAVAALVDDIEGRGFAVSAGDVGYRYVLRALADAGRSDVIARMVRQRDRPGYAYQLEQGATSLTEAWDANRRNSQNHFMLGQVVEWFYQDLAGLGVDPDEPGFRNTLVRPQPVAGVSWAEASHDSPRGPVRVRWESGGGGFRLVLTVPPNATATVFMPSVEPGAVSESGGPASRAEGVEFLRREGDREVFRVEAGAYDFRSPW